MPLYEFRCRKCGRDYEVIKSFKDDADHDTCPYCEGPADRVFAGAPVVEYHGSGYYVTDHNEHGESKKNE